jgi:hypothetical protein
MLAERESSSSGREHYRASLGTSRAHQSTLTTRKCDTYVLHKTMQKAACSRRQPCHRRVTPEHARQTAQIGLVMRDFVPSAGGAGVPHFAFVNSPTRHRRLSSAFCQPKLPCIVSSRNRAHRVRLRVEPTHYSILFSLSQESATLAPANN